MISIQIQSVLYNNNKKNLIRSLQSIDNAIKNTKNFIFNKVTVKYGDASKTPILNNLEIENLKKQIKFFSFQYVFFNSNTGSAKGHNILSSGCNCKYIQIMNPDIILSPNFFDESLSAFKLQIKQKNVAMVEARQVPIEHPKEYNVNTGETEWATTACAIISYDIFKTLNGFDDKTFFLYCDDLDFSWRLRLLGFVIIYQPKSIVFHPKYLSSPECKWCATAAEKYYSKEAALLMAYKWSNNNRVHELLELWKNGSEEEKKICKKFFDLKDSNMLPEQLDPHGKIAMFDHDFYSHNRFCL